MSSVDQIREWARDLKDTQDRAGQIPPFTSRFEGFDAATAYKVAHRIHCERLREGATPVGRKIGFTNPDMWSLYGVQEPIWAYVYDTTVVRSGPQRETCALGRFAEPKIEPEIVLHFRAAPPLGGDPSDILDCIDWIAHGFEIVQSHFPGWKFRAADTVADWALHGTLLVGEPRPVERLGAGLVEQLQRFRVTLLRDGKVREEGKATNVLGSPLLAVAHLVVVLASQPEQSPIQAGELVTTGTLTTAQSVRPGECWSTRLDGIDLPGLSVQFSL